MPWTYSQSTGKLIDPNGKCIATGYSGSPAGKNNPTMQAIKDVGPIPQGHYSVDGPMETTEHGPYALPLIPWSEDQLYGRSGFLMHGDSLTAPGDASKGCVIMPRFARERVWESDDHQLVVVT